MAKDPGQIKQRLQQMCNMLRFSGEETVVLILHRLSGEKTILGSPAGITFLVTEKDIELKFKTYCDGWFKNGTAGQLPAEEELQTLSDISEDDFYDRDPDDPQDTKPDHIFQPYQTAKTQFEDNPYLSNDIYNLNARLALHSSPGAKAAPNVERYNDDQFNSDDDNKPGSRQELNQYLENQPNIPTIIQICSPETQHEHIDTTLGVNKKVLSAYEFHRHLEPSCTQPLISPFPNQQGNRHTLFERDVVNFINIERKELDGQNSGPVIAETENDNYLESSPGEDFQSLDRANEQNNTNANNQNDTNANKQSNTNANKHDSTHTNDQNITHACEEDNINASEDNITDANNQTNTDTYGQDNLNIDDQDHADEIKDICKDTEKRSTKKASRPQESLVCKICNKVLSSVRNLNNHLKTHGPLVCKVCQKPMSSVIKLNKHLLTHKTATLCCQVCHREFRDQFYLDRHMCVHNTDKLSCEVCEATFTTVRNLQNHRSRHEESKQYTCTVCGQEFRLKSFLKQHMNTHNYKNKKVCTVCGKQFTSAKGLKIHIDSKHLKDNKYSCTFCKKEFFSQSLLNHHVNRKHKNKHFQCLYCDKIFTRSESLKMHENTHTKTKIYTCEICGQVYFRYPSFRLHQRKHSRQYAPIKCPYCSQQFRSNVTMTTHVKHNHVTEDQSSCSPIITPCSVCGKLFSNRQSYQWHIDMHAGIKRHKCDICEIGFSDPSNLRAHQRIHTEDKIK